MAQAYLAERMSGTAAVFETFFRKLPRGRSYEMAAGLSDVLDFLEEFRFEQNDLDYLRGLGLFRDELRRPRRGALQPEMSGQAHSFAKQLGDRFNVVAVRLDSGDLGDLSKEARAKLNAGRFEPGRHLRLVGSRRIPDSGADG